MGNRTAGNYVNGADYECSRNAYEPVNAVHEYFMCRICFFYLTLSSCKFTFCSSPNRMVVNATANHVVLALVFGVDKSVRLNIVLLFRV